ncbi:MAG: HEAT repeat domain-containing protein [Iphinoe sp. HA4291-MV1]|jgi:predicted NACHT family NTPase|nr:HEAT repeat domain-containing protein [Iphinoe sp. HA4291-MV1]
MVEWFISALATNAVGLLVKTILNEEFAKDLAKDYAKDFFKDRFNNVTTALFQKEPLQKAIAKALKEFLQLVEDELRFRRLCDEEIKKFAKSLKTFIYDKSVKEVLGKAFDADCDSLDYQTLQKTWQSLRLPPLPAKFNWQLVSDNYLRKAQQILFESDELRNILILQKLDAIEKSDQERSDIQPDFNLLKYQEVIRERYANLKLDSLETSGYAYNELRLWRMFIPQKVRKVHQVLPQVHELPKEHLRRLRERNELEAEEILQEELERQKRDYFEQTVRSVKEVVEDKQKYKYVVILGDPGSGKSTLLQYLALDWVEQTLDKLDKTKNYLPIPLLIELRAYMRRREDKECSNFLEFFHKCSGAIAHLNQHKLQEELRAGNALVMFDGLDEVFDSGKREDVITDIHRFTNEYPDVQVIVTSRVIGYKPQRLRDAGFKHFMLQDLEAEQIQDFVNCWHSETFVDKVDGERKRKRLQKAIDTSNSIAELAGNPLLLTMMAILNRNQELPRDRAELYNQASRVLLHQWDVERALVEDKRLDSKTIDYKDKQAMLRQVAYHMQTSEKGLAGNLICANDLERILTGYLKTIEVDKARVAARVMINQLRTRNFMLCFLGADYYAFVHRTFLEYFCAWEFVWQFKETQTLEIEELKTEVFGKHWWDETWHEVLRLIAGMIEPKFVGEILEYLMAQNGEEEKFSNLFLAAKCFSEVRNRTVIAKTAQELLNNIKDLTKYDLNYYYDPNQNEEEIKLVQEIRTQAVAAIATTWEDDAETLAFLKTRATADDNSSVRGAALQALASNYKDDADTLAILKTRATADDNSSVRGAALQALASNYKDDADTLAILKTRAIDDNYWDVRYAAVQAIASNYKDDADTLAILKTRATADDHSSVRYAAVQALASNYKDDADTKAFLKTRATADDHWDVRRAAVQALASNYKDDADTKAFLKTRATADDNEYVRRAAVEALASNYKDDADTKAFLKTRATADDHWDVRGAAVEALASNYKDDADTKAFLKTRATADDSYVRSAAVEALASNYKDDADTKAFLKTRATDDDNEYVQYTAVEALASNYKDDADTKAILKTRATADDDSDVRGAALQALASNYKDDADTLAFLKTRATADDNSSVRRAAVQALASNYKDDADTLAFLKTRATADDTWDVRYAAVQALASNYKDDADTLAFLKTRATADDNSDVRGAAVQALGKNFPYQPELFDIYYNCAVNDPFERKESYETNPRQVALEIIIKQHPHHPQTLPLLHDRAENDPDEQVREFAQKKLAELEK